MKQSQKRDGQTGSRVEERDEELEMSRSGGRKRERRHTEMRGCVRVRVRDLGNKNQHRLKRT